MSSNDSLKSSATKTEQLPLKGFRMPYDKKHEKFRFDIEGMGDGRYRIHAVPKTRQKGV